MSLEMPCGGERWRGGVGSLDRVSEAPEVELHHRTCLEWLDISSHLALAFRDDARTFSRREKPDSGSRDRRPLPAVPRDTRTFEQAPTELHRL
jgi:hypothetical protein